jgi:hypothetical protein
MGNNNERKKVDTARNRNDSKKCQTREQNRKERKKDE